MDAESVAAIATAAATVGIALINKVSEAIGAAVEPALIRKRADAEKDAAITKAEGEADVALIKTETAIEITDKRRRALMRWVSELDTFQENIELVTGKAIPLLAQDARPNDIDVDWLRDFFDKAKQFSSEQMQTYFARILAGEANVPGSYSRAVVHALSILEKQDAELLVYLRSRTVVFGDHLVLMASNTAKLLNENPLCMEHMLLTNAEELGFIQYRKSTANAFPSLSPKVAVTYGTKTLLFESGRDDGKVFTGPATYKRVGYGLARISDFKFEQAFLKELRVDFSPDKTTLTVLDSAEPIPEGFATDQNFMPPFAPS